MGSTYLMTLQCICSGLEVLTANRQLSETEKKKQLEIAIDQILNKVKI